MVAQSVRKTLVGRVTLVVAVLATLAILPSANARILVPNNLVSNLVTNHDENAHVRFEEDHVQASQSNWGRGVESAITVGDTCDRADDFAVASWISMYVFDSTGTATTWHQVGWDQNFDTRGCQIARVFYQSCQMPCTQPGHYTPFYPSTDNYDVPSDGLGSVFQLVIHDTTGSNPPAACFSVALEMTADATDIRCPIVATPNEAAYFSCVYALKQAEIAGEAAAATTECDSLDLQEMETLAAQTEPCATPTDPLGLLLRGLNYCQAAEAAKLVLTEPLPTCPDPSDTNSVPIICAISSDDAASSEAVQRNGPCYVIAYRNKVQFTPDAYDLSDCDTAATTRVEYEAANDLGNSHSGPGSSDDPAKFSQWRYIGTSGVGPKVDDAALTFSSIADGDTTACPPYEGRYKVAAGLVDWVEVGPNVGGSTNWCGTEVTSGTPAPAFIVGALAVVLCAWAQRRRGK